MLENLNEFYRLVNYRTKNLFWGNNKIIKLILMNKKFGILKNPSFLKMSKHVQPCE